MGVVLARGGVVSDGEGLLQSLNEPTGAGGGGSILHALFVRWLEGHVAAVSSIQGLVVVEHYEIISILHERE